MMDLDINLKLDEFRIAISGFATKDHEIEALQNRFSSVAATLAGFAANQDAEGYTVAVEELGRISRRIIWEFVRSGSCNESQVTAAMNLFETCDFGVTEAAGSNVPAVEDFIDGIRLRANQLRAALEAHEVGVFSEQLDE